MSFLEQYREGRPSACKNKDGFSTACVGLLVTPTGVSWMDEQYILADAPPKSPAHHLFGPVVEKGETLVCAGHQFRIVDHGDECAAVWNMIQKDFDIQGVHDFAHHALALERPGSPE